MIPSMLFIGKKDDFYCERAAEFVRLHFPERGILLGKRGEALPETAGWWRGDYIVSYLSPWVIPAYLLRRAKRGAINFHPGPPEYPGIGCTNFAVYHEASTFGVTCHHMKPKVDTGDLIRVKRFPLYSSDTVFSLTQRCYAEILALFYEIMDLILADEELPRLDESWTAKPTTRRQLDDLCQITPAMPPEEVRQRVRAVTFPNAPGAFVEIHGTRFNYEIVKE